MVLISLTALHLPYFKVLSLGDSGSYWNSQKSWLKSDSVLLLTNRISSCIQQPDPVVWESRVIRPYYSCSVKYMIKVPLMVVRTKTGPKFILLLFSVWVWKTDLIFCIWKETRIKKFLKRVKMFEHLLNLQNIFSRLQGACSYMNLLFFKYCTSS